MNEISQSLDAYSRNAESEVRRLHRNLSEYIETLRRHIHAEDKIFYPLVARTLTKSEMLELAEEFDKYAAKAGPDLTKAHETLIDEMGRLL
jgi:hemerythrin-like domain-containing protein